MILCWAAFTAILSHMWPVGLRWDTLCERIAWKNLELTAMSGNAHRISLLTEGHKSLYIDFIAHKYVFWRTLIYLFIFREGEGREKKRERNISVWLSFMWPPLRTWPVTQVCALTGNRTGDPLVLSLCSIH